MTEFQNFAKRLVGSIGILATIAAAGCASTPGGSATPAQVATFSHPRCASATVDTIAFAYQDNNATPMSEIERITSDASMLGFVSVQPYRSVELKQNGQCWDVQVRAGYVNAVLYVPHEYEPGTCEFDHIHTHELRHIAVYQQTTQTASINIAKRIAASGLPSDETEAKREVVRIAHEELFSAAVANQEIDSPSEYKHNKTACFGKVVDAWKHHHIDPLALEEQQRAVLAASAAGTR